MKNTEIKQAKCPERMPKITHFVRDNNIEPHATNMESKKEVKLGRRRRSKLEMMSSPYQEEVEKRLVNEPPEKTHLWLKQEGISISTRTLRRYRNQLIIPRILVEKGLFEKFRPFTEKKIDALGDLYAVIRIQRTRIEKSLELEDIQKKINSSCSKEIELLMKILVKIIELEMLLGIRKEKDESVANLAEELRNFRILRKLASEHPEIHKKLDEETRKG